MLGTLGEQSVPTVLLMTVSEVVSSNYLIIEALGWRCDSGWELQVDIKARIWRENWSIDPVEAACLAQVSHRGAIKACIRCHCGTFRCSVGA